MAYLRGAPALTSEDRSIGIGPLQASHGGLALRTASVISSLGVPSAHHACPVGGPAVLQSSFLE